MNKDIGRVLTDPALVSDQAPAGLDASRFDPSREELIQRAILAISTASVPHPSPIPGALESRSLSYYLGVGIDHFNHDYERHERLIRKAAELVVQALCDSDGSATAARPGTGLDPKDDSAGLQASPNLNQRTDTNG